jgi:hypothetical protein
MVRANSLKRWTVRGGLAVVASGALVAGLVVAITPAHAATVNPYSPAAGHPYRHGAVPTREAAQQMASYQASHLSPAASGADLLYGGTVDGIGVTTGKPKVYLIFWGKQWGSPTTDANGNVVLSGDPVGMAPRLQSLFKGLGTQNEKWSGTMTQYCEGITKGASSCPASAAHVGYPTGGAFAGIWVDNGANSPASATEQQIGIEAVAAASHFGNTNATLNRSAQYVVVSPHGSTPDGFNTPNGGFCAWHDWNGDDTLLPGPVPSTVGDVAFTNLPYVTDAGGSCGQGFVNPGAPGALDGVSIVEGHEYAETISDQNPPGGWVDGSGAENGDKCAWVSVGQGASANVGLSTGSFAMQSTWSNDTERCEISHDIVGGQTGGTDYGIAVAPTSTAVTTGTHTITAQVSSQVFAGTPGPVTLTVQNVPIGTTGSISPSTIPASGGTATLTLKTTSTTSPGTYQVAVVGQAGTLFRQAPFTLALYRSTGSVSNGGFERGLATWTTSGAVTTVIDTIHSGLSAARVGVRDQPKSGPAITSTLRKTFTVKAGQSHLTLWYELICTDQLISDWFTVTVKDNTANKTSTLVPRSCREDGAFRQVTATVTAGHSYSLVMSVRDDGNAGDPTFAYVDDVATS